MPKFMLRRTWDDLSADAMREISMQMIQRARDYDGVRWVHSHPVVDDEGRLTTYCVYESPDAERVVAHALDVGYHSVDDVLEIVADLEPSQD